jgi:hypothetical protein
MELISKRFSLVKVKAGENFNRRNTLSISRIEISNQRRDWPKWDVLKLAQCKISSCVWNNGPDIAVDFSKITSVNLFDNPLLTKKEIIMLRHVWAGKIGAGKLQKAMEWIPKVKTYYKKYDSISNQEFFLNMFGESGVLVIMSNFKDLAAYQKLIDQLPADPGYAKLSEDAGKVFIEGSIHTYIMRPV